MGEREDGGSAFPGESPSDYWKGMTLRDYFAAKAMQGMLANGNAAFIESVIKRATANGTTQNEELASRAYGVADTMLSHKDKSNG